jgi:hypothetical protein
MSNGDETDVNPFVQLRALKEQQAGGTPAPAAPNPFMQREKNPFLRIRPNAPFSMEEEHPIVSAVERIFTGTVKDVSNFLVQAVQSGAAGRMPSEAGQLQTALEAKRYLDALPPEERESGLRGFAFTASFAAGPVAASLLPTIAGPLTATESLFLRPGPVLGKWGSLAATEFLGGGINGALRPLDEDESRTSAVLGDASMFATMGLGFKLMATPVALLKRRMMRLPPAQFDAATRAVKEQLAQVNSQLSGGGVNLNQLPPDMRAKIEEPILRQVLQQVDPASRDVDGAIRAEADREIETAGRFDQPVGKPLLPERLATPEDEFDKHMRQLLIDHPMGKTPPLEKSAAAPEAGPPEEHIVSVAVMGKDGHVYKPKRGEITHPELMTNLIDFDGVSPNAFFQDEKGQFLQGASRGYITSKGAYVTVDQATAAGLQKRSLAELARSHAERGEQIVGPAVRGRSGDTYVGEPTHPEIMAQAMRDGTPKKEFKGVLDDADHPGRGFRTTHREFVTREQAAEITGHPVPLFSEEMHSNKMLPTQSIEVAEKAVVSNPAAALDVATDHATARLDPLQTATPGVKAAAKELGEMIETHGLPEKPAPVHLRNLLSKSLDRVGPAADRGVILTLTNPGPIELQIGRKLGSSQLKKIREQLANTLRREEPLISVSPHERVAAPWNEVDPDLTVPKKMDGFEIAAHVRDEKLEEFNQALLDVARNKKGFIKPEYMARLAATGIGGTMEAIAWYDDNLTDGERVGLGAFGGMLLTAAAFPAFRRLNERSQFVRDLVRTVSPARAMSAGGEKWRAYTEAFTRSGLKQHEAQIAIKSVFPDEASSRAAMYALDEGPAASEFRSLTPNQQRMAVIMNQFDMRMAIRLKATGALEGYVDNYVRHLLPEKSFRRWEQIGGARALPTGRAGLLSVRDLEAWTKKEGLPGPIMDVGSVHSYHMAENDRSLATANLRRELGNVGHIVAMPPAGTALPTGWRDVSNIPGLRGMMAPEEDAHDLGIISKFTSPKGDVLRALDRVKSRWVKSIMFWWWEHGLNAMRSYLALSFNPTKYFDGVKWLEHPAIREEMASVGVNIYGHSADYLLRVQDNWKGLTDKIGLPRVGERIDALQEKNDRILWEKVIPALQTFAYVTRMRDWTERNAGKFGGPEYLAEARRVADFANTVAGKVPQTLTDPRLAQGMRLLMFSPQWTGTRMAMWAHAAGEVSDMIDGKLNPRDALYLPMKMRQLAWGIGLTYAGSMLLSGKPPEFNPNNSRFYMNTGSRDARGRQIGVDLTGWWQDEFRFFNHPLDFLMNRVNPVLKVGVETLQSRDYLGRPMTTGQSIGNIISSFGPPAQIAGDVAKLARGQRIGGGDVWQMASRALATGNVAALPPAMDVMMAKYAKKILINQGIPATSDYVYELAQRMRSNLINGRELVDEGTVQLLAAHKRSAMWEFPVPGSAAFNGIWEEARGVLADFMP